MTASRFLSNLQIQVIFYPQIEVNLAEKIMLSVVVQKVNRKRNFQKRILMITTHCIYNIKQSFLLKGFSIRNKFPITSLSSAVYSKRSDEIILQFESHFDLHYSTSEKDNILQYIFQAKEFEDSGDNNLKIFFIDEPDLHLYC